MNTCIYCGEEKDEAEFTFEHVIPQSLGGAYAPDRFKTHDVCKGCNGAAGLFVDAAFEKDWFVQNWLRMSAMAFFDPEHPSALPLICMGISSLSPPGMMSDEVCESWLGPLGEQVYWIRKHDEQLYWYVGGNPRTARDSASRAYFFFSARTHKNPIISWLAFREAFSNRKRVRKVMCTEVRGSDPKEIGFAEPDEIDNERITFFKSLSGVSGRELRNQLSINVDFDRRFLAKLGLGIGYCLFGKKVLGSEYTKELRKAMWFREGVATEADEFPEVYGMGGWSSKTDGALTALVAEEHAVCAIISLSGNGVVVTLSVGKAMAGTIKCAEIGDLEPDMLNSIGEGLVILIYKHLRTSVTLSLLEYVAYKLGNYAHPRLQEINNRIAKNAGYFKNL